ncbi:nucleotidyltransferase family protein [Paenibacillus piri]|uniref:Nucleotidyltransferase family protein n=1 Tax=Paenibacillus piri TaxID=2547395 RepID=A0A4R5KW95_9BACL|nr:nucleotidyltransferase family protein [Paenibacillus piri]TDG00290.1 hypothetical protein E1757_01200 [Paenibacillus piri]
MVIPLLQCLYNPEQPFPAAGWDYEAILRDIELFSIGSQMYHLLKASGRIEQVPEFFGSRLKARHARATYHNLFMKHKEQEMLALFERHGLEAIPLKGIRFAEAYFGHFAARVTSDIDLFVRADRLDEAIACLESHGYDYEITKDHHARLHKDGLMAELHWTLDKREWSNLHTEPFWSSAVPLGDFRYVKQLSPLHTFYFICLHGARHQMDSVRYLIDIVQILHAKGGSIDYKQLVEQTTVDKTSRRIQAVLSIVYRQFPHLQAIKPLPFDTLETHWDYEMVRSARMGAKTKQYYLYKLFFRHFIFDTWKHQMKSIRKAY